MLLTLKIVECNNVKIVIKKQQWKDAPHPHTPKKTKTKNKLVQNDIDYIMPSFLVSHIFANFLQAKLKGCSNPDKERRRKRLIFKVDSLSPLGATLSYTLPLWLD